RVSIKIRVGVKGVTHLKKGKVEAKEEPIKTKYPREVLSVVARRIEEVKELVPRRLPDGGYTYQEMEELDLKVDQRKLLEYMTENSYLEKKPAETMLVCPNCHEVNIVPIFKCRSCNSLSMRRERLIEHKAGGHIHPESSFKPQEDRITCPSCGKALKADEWRTLGAWFVCSECGERQAQITSEFKCLKDDTNFTPVMGEFVTLYKYTLTEKAKSLLGFDESTVTDNVIQVLEEKGEVERRFSIKGKSGVEHVFDISCISGGKRLLIDVAFSSQPIDDSVVLASFAKTFEVKDEDYLLIVWPGLSESAQDLVKFYKIKMIQATNLNDLRSELKEFIAKQK
ncbi:MAG: hypothetical protein ACE5KU_01620, partial [Nitrososphaerales archaeon]